MVQQGVQMQIQTWLVGEKQHMHQIRTQNVIWKMNYSLGKPSNQCDALCHNWFTFGKTCSMYKLYDNNQMEHTHINMWPINKA